MSPFSLLIKPASGNCNIRCGYCFYREKLALFDAKAGRRMTPETLKVLIEKFMGLGFIENTFSWQGGEPLLMGLPFYQQAVAFQKQYGRSGQRVGNSVQTNGLLIDDAWCAFFNEYKFLTGISLDGPEDVNNVFRRNREGEPVFGKVMKAVETFQRNNTAFNVLTVISRANVNRAGEVYRFLKGIGIRYHQYIPAILTKSQQESDAAFGITGEEYGSFLLDLFHEWHPSDVRTVSIRFFDAIINSLVTGNAHYCEMGKNCDGYLVVEHNGDIYPCDFFVEKKWRMGNIRKQSFEEIRKSPKQVSFNNMKLACDPECKTCEFFSLCHGGCVRHRDYADTRPESRSALCNGLRLFFSEALPVFKALAESLNATG